MAVESVPCETMITAIGFFESLFDGLSGKGAAFITDFLKKRHEIMLNPGILYGEAGEGFVRINIACPKAVLLEGLQRLQKGLCGLQV